MSIRQILEYNFLNIGDFYLNLWDLILAVVIYIGARTLVWAMGRILGRYFNKKKVDAGRRYAFQQFVKYIIYTIATLMVIEAIGVQLSVLWGGAAALLVGIGLGLQQTFNDLISGIILLIEGSVEVGDVIKVEGLVGTVKSINVRTSRVETRDNVSILVPNSKMVGENAINWSHTEEPTRFQIQVGVAYNSDVKLVNLLLMQAANEHPAILKSPTPKIQFIDFGNSSLDFKLHFYSKEYLMIEFVKSDIRYRIIELFRKNNVEIPFPQRDLWLRNAETPPIIDQEE